MNSVLPYTLLFFALLAISIPELDAQQHADTLKSDTLKKLPFAIADEKKLSEEDLANKKEGVYLTGIPDISSDPVNGFGYGGQASIFFNGKKSDPFFEYTPYRAEI